MSVPVRPPEGSSALGRDDVARGSIESRRLATPNIAPSATVSRVAGGDAHGAVGERRIDPRRQHDRAPPLVDAAPPRRRAGRAALGGELARQPSDRRACVGASAAATARGARAGRWSRSGRRRRARGRFDGTRPAAPTGSGRGAGAPGARRSRAVAERLGAARRLGGLVRSRAGRACCRARAAPSTPGASRPAA